MAESLAARNSERVAAIKDRIVATSAKALIGLPEETRTTCRLGGSPDMPSTLEWPYQEATPMTFLAQIDLSQLPRCDALAWLPSSGFLFYFAGQRAGEWVEETATVLYSEERSIGPRIGPSGALIAIREQSLRFELKRTYEPLSAEHDACNDDDNREIDTWYYKLSPGFRAWQIGGWPRQIQNHDMPLRAEQKYKGALRLYHGEGEHNIKCELSRWRLLGQFQLEQLFANTSGYSHGYFWVKDSEAQSQRFDRVVLLGQAG